ncbi:MAG: anti-sigma factor family protein [Planctomycetota bacterium]
MNAPHDDPADGALPRDPGSEEDRKLWLRLDGKGQSEGCPEPMELAGYADGRLAPDRAGMVEEHLAGCAACIEAVLETRRLLGDLPELPPAPVSVVQAARDLVPDGELEVIGRIGPLSWQGIGRWSVAAAAMIAICVVGYRTGSRMPSTTGPASSSLVSEMSFGLFDGLDGEDGLELVTIAMAEGGAS